MVCRDFITIYLILLIILGGKKQENILMMILVRHGGNTFYCVHYENMFMQYTDFSSAVKIENFHWTNFDIFLIFAQNIDCGYTLEPPR